MFKDGRVVKGTEFVNLRDAGDPVEAAKIYDQQGADELVLLDITASSDAKEVYLLILFVRLQVAFLFHLQLVAASEPLMILQKFSVLVRIRFQLIQPL